MHRFQSRRAQALWSCFVAPRFAAAGTRCALQPSTARTARRAGVAVAPDVAAIGPFLRQALLQQDAADITPVGQLDVDQQAPVRVAAPARPNPVAARQQGRSRSRATMAMRLSFSHWGSDSSGVSMEMKRHLRPLSRPVSPSMRHVRRPSTEHSATGPSRSSPAGSVKRSHAATAINPRQARRTPVSSHDRVRRTKNPSRACSGGASAQACGAAQERWPASAMLRDCRRKHPP